jgi:hypothetical protein
MALIIVPGVEQPALTARLAGDACPISPLWLFKWHLENTMEEQHIYHHSDSDGARITVKVEKNTKGFNYEASVSGAKTVEEALLLLKEAQAKLQAAYGGEAG